ncbi:MAG: M28 family peptidase [Candidatus Cyclobacteriaceae bacterium M3_2C_046]
MKPGKIFVLLISLVLLAAQSAFWLNNEPEKLEPALESIDEAEIKSHLRFLSHDLLKGRDVGSPGYQIAANYLISRFQAMGLKPGREDSSFIQPVWLYKSQANQGNQVTLYNNQKDTLLDPMDYIFFQEHPEQDMSGEHEVVFAGYGINDPETGYNSYKNLVVKDKMVLVLNGLPPGFSSPYKAILKDSQTKANLARKKGASGIIVLYASQLQDFYPFHWLSQYHQRRLKVPQSPDGFAKLYLNGSALEKFLDIPLDELIKKAASPPLSGKHLFSLKYDISGSDNYEKIESENIAAILPGSDPLLKNEYLVYTAHLDHVGVGRTINGDSIYNGAYDNGSGISIMLEVAQAFSQLPVKPDRSILFLALTAEEKGLLGANYFVENPIIPLANIVANINIDMFLMEKPLEKLVPLGIEYADFADLIRNRAMQLDISFIPDPMPEQSIFTRSDHYQFVLKGIPSLFFVNDLTAPANAKWFNTYYHKPGDEYREDMHFDAAVKFARFNFLIGYDMANRQKAPAWNHPEVFN